MNNKKTGVELIAIERQEQIEKHGRSIQDDQIYTEHQLPFAAIAYAIPDGLESVNRKHYWPWSLHWWNPSPENRIKELAKAGALIAAEIDRLLNQ